MRKPAFYICKKKGADQLHGNRAADQCLFFLLHRYSTIPKFQAFSHLWVHSSVCVGPGVNPEDRFSHILSKKRKFTHFR